MKILRTRKITNTKREENAYIEESKYNYYVTIKKWYWEYAYIIQMSVSKKIAKNPMQAYNYVIYGKVEGD